MYGAQAKWHESPQVRLFENDVEMYGAQASENVLSLMRCLRMM